MTTKEKKQMSPDWEKLEKLGNKPETIPTEKTVSDCSIKLHTEKPTSDEIAKRNIRYSVYAKDNHERMISSNIPYFLNDFVNGTIQYVKNGGLYACEIEKSMNTPNPAEMKFEQSETSGEIAGSMQVFINMPHAEREWEAVNKACSQAGKMFEFIAAKGFIPTGSEIENGARSGDFSSLVKRFKENEYKKIEPFVKQFGNTPLTDGIDDKITQMTEAFKKELLSSRQMIHYCALNFFDYLDFEETGVSIKKEYNLEYFRLKYSVNFTGTKYAAFYKKHVECCRLLNELSDKPDNEFAALDKLFWFNPESKEFELNILAYYPAVFEKEDSGLTEFLK